MINVAINGFGRIGRIATRVLLGREDLQKELNLVAINTSGSMPAGHWAHLLKYDTAYGPLRHELKLKEVSAPQLADPADPLIGSLTLGTNEIALLAQPDPGKLPWEKYA
ncbi:MAG: type I glyceraldehyde-3-phosphate dehydrogenase, partial [Candidatus Chisholmbacteria bacterium]|nr:type I glyceraldehyde-3-phosphate dehydrogenase [Candidatus Chisholmbacteria bacterium]